MKGLHRTTKSRTAIASFVVVALWLLAGAGDRVIGYERPGNYQRIDIAGDGQEAEGAWGGSTSIDAGGRFVAFDHMAGNLVPGDNNLMSDVFVKNAEGGSLDLASGGLAGVPAAGVGHVCLLLPPPGAPECPVPAVWLSFDPSISASGRFVSFTSAAANLVVGDTNLLDDVFVHDRKMGRTERISISSAGDQASGVPGGVGSVLPSISANGRFISFTSDAINLADGDTNGEPDVFVHDRVKRTTTRVSVDSGGNQSEICSDPLVLECLLSLDGDGITPRSALSATGRYVVFDSPASDLVAGDTNGVYDVFIHDRKSHKTERVSVASDGAQATSLPALEPCTRFGSSLTGFRYHPASRAVSGDGRYVTFVSTAENLVPNDTNRDYRAGTVACSGVLGMDAFLHDRRTGRTERVSVGSTGRQRGSKLEGYQSLHPTLSATGRHVAFYEFSDLYADESIPIDKWATLAVHDRTTGAMHIARRGPKTPDRQWSGFAEFPDISRTGRFVSYREWYQPPSLLSGVGFHRWDRGNVLDSGSGRSGTKSDEQTSDELICLTPDVCVSPGAGLFVRDAVRGGDEDLVGAGGDLYGASLAYRPQYQDLFVAVELEYMPKVIPAISPFLYGLRFEVEGKNYEVRAAALQGGTFALFDCDGDLPACTKVADLRGGYGTTGMRVVFSLPLEEIGIQDGGRLENVAAFSALGSYLSGSTQVLDLVKLR